jgi:hypothetical protein
MEKNEILEAAHETEDTREYESRVFSKASRLALAVVFLVAAIISCVEYFVAKNFNVGLWIVTGVGVGIFDFYYGIKTKKVSDIIRGSILLTISIICVIIWVVMIWLGV